MTRVVVIHEIALARPAGTRLVITEHVHVAVDGAPVESIEDPPNQGLRGFIHHVEKY